ncbi:MAG: hypothetical protein V1806_03310 [Pseudomonadota bacterium]
MSANTSYPRGLTRIIFETLVALTPGLAAEGESLSPALLARVEQEVHRQLAPQGNGRDRLFFDMVFGRSFAEASDLMLSTSTRPARPKTAPRPVALQAMA